MLLGKYKPLGAACCFTKIHQTHCALINAHTCSGPRTVHCTNFTCVKSGPETKTHLFEHRWFDVLSLLWRRFTNLTGTYLHKFKKKIRGDTGNLLLLVTHFYLSCPEFQLECGPMPNVMTVMAALRNIGGALCWTPQSLADAHYQSAAQ